MLHYLTYEGQNKETKKQVSSTLTILHYLIERNHKINSLFKRKVVEVNVTFFEFKIIKF